MADSNGSILIWQINPIFIVKQIEVNPRIEITCIETVNNILLVALYDGTIHMYDMGADGKEKFTKSFLTWKVNTGIRCLQVR